MTVRQTSTHRSRLLAIVALVALLAAACSSTVVRTAADRVDAPEPVLDLGPEYGASLDEWSSAVSESGGHQEPLVLDGSANVADEASNSEYATIGWEDLIPPGLSGTEIVDRYEDRLDAVEVGSPEATALYEEMQAEFDSDAVNTELDGQKIRLAGFVAPLTYDDIIVTEFLLVPNFGACIHVPPPPPNQTIMVTVDKENGLTPDEAWGAVWVEGTITLDAATTDLANASYTITGGTSGVYNDF